MEEKKSTATLPFITVFDKEIANMLETNGFVCVNKTNEMFTFINNDKLTFSENIDKNKIKYTNVLCV